MGGTLALAHPKNLERKTKNTMKKQKKVVGYIRVSTDKQMTEGHSLERQAALIRDWSVMKGLILRGIYQDTMSARREGNHLAP